MRPSIVGSIARMLVEIAYRGVTGAGDADAVDLRFDVLGWRSQEHLRSVFVRVASLTIMRLRNKYGGGNDKAGESLFERAAITAGLRLIEALGPALLESTDHLLRVVDYPEIDATTSERKHCSHQQRRSGDLFCVAAEKSQGGRSRTTLHACETQCALPDTRSLCSGFVHLEVAMAGSMTAAPAPVLMSRICEMGHQSRIEEPTVRCTPDGHDCWRRVLDLTTKTAEVPLPPLALNEALDFLSWVWRAKFDKAQKLIQLASASPAAEIGQACSSPEEFLSRMNAIKELIDAVKIDAQLTPGVKASDGTLTRLELALSANLPQLEFDRAKRGIGVLRDAVNLRNGLIHSASGQKAPAGARGFNIDWPPANWGDAWERVRDQLARAVRDIRQAIEATI